MHKFQFTNPFQILTKVRGFHDEKLRKSSYVFEDFLLHKYALISIVGFLSAITEAIN